MHGRRESTAANKLKMNRALAGLPNESLLALGDAVKFN